MTNNINIFCFHGKPCAGKDSQAEILLNQFENSIKISTGEIFRGAKSRKGEFGKYYEVLKEDIKVVNKGGLIRDHIIVGIVSEVIKNHILERKRTFIFTGFPRTIPQAEEFNKMIKDLESIYDINEKHIFLHVSDEIAIERSQKRREKDIFKYGVSRKEDEPTSFLKRLDYFENLTFPMIKQIEKTKTTFSLDASKSIDEVSFEVLSSLGLFRSGKERK